MGALSLIVRSDPPLHARQRVPGSTTVLEIWPACPTRIGYTPGDPGWPINWDTDGFWVAPTGSEKKEV